ncbi:hypothetical protein [Polluticoccus soli]|uniref:hypothetical protein n=1 Tax=Polluticoccus soli TaxID=3034150 RepID=UPI0023E173D6|nr:hypothetical protein [Flavipsychrobacter sp. JY13-12]
MNSRLLNLRSINMRGIRSLLPGARPSFLGIRGLSRAWGILGLIALGVGVLAYPTLLLVRSLRTRLATARANGQLGTFKNFLPSVRGKHKPHHRKVESESSLKTGMA